MIFDDLVTTTKAMQTLQRKKKLKDNKDRQDNTDTKYRLLLDRTNRFVNVIVYLYAKAGLPGNSEIVSSLSALMDDLEQIVAEGLASGEGVAGAENSFNTLQGIMKKEWAKQYADFTGATVSTLEAIKGIAPDRVNDCLEKIKPAKVWELDVKKFEKMSESLKDADRLIAGLGLDDEIIAFLQNTNCGKATLQDLNDKVLTWIRNEKLEQKIRISFVKTR